MGGEFVDTVKVGDIEIQNVALGLDINGDGEMGSLGLGPNRTGNAAPSLLDHMVMQHRINSSAYSLWLDNPGMLLLLPLAIPTNSQSPQTQTIQPETCSSALSTFPSSRDQWTA